MGEEVKNNENKKKQKVAILIGVVTLLIAVLGATYAYFQISTDTNSSNTNITGSTPANGLVTLTPGTSNLHLNISASDMSEANANNVYYATDDGQPYVGTEELGTKTIASVELTGGEETTKYSCTAKLTVSKVTEEDPDTMIDVLHSGDMILQFKGNIISDRLDLNELKTTESKTYNLSFKITGNTSEEIQTYIKLVNKEEQQNYLAGKKLNIDISTSELKCNVFIPDPKIAELREKDSQGYLSKDLQGGMYRYQAAGSSLDTANMTNWICFGTKDKEACTNEETGIDKYMYRIIGITEEGQLYLLKETFLKEGDSTEFSWNTKFDISDCLGEACDWTNADLYKRLNGIESNGNPIFVDNSEYEYMAKGTNWYNLIADHEWMYGDIGETPSLNTYKGQPVYEIETGRADVNHYVGVDESITEETYRWTQKAKEKINLMFIHDYYYSYYDGITEESRGNAGSYSKLKNSWIHFQKDGYNISPNYEWLSTRRGSRSSSISNVNAYYVDNSGDWYIYNLNYENGVRPVFYLSSEAKIKDGDGTKANPYILDVQE